MLMGVKAFSSGWGSPQVRLPLVVSRIDPSRLQETGRDPVAHCAGMAVVVYQQAGLQELLGIFPGRFPVHLKMLLKIP